MSVFLRGLHIASKQIAYLLIIIFTIIILLVGAAYWLADAVNKRQDEIAVWVGDKLGYPVELGNVGLSWRGVVPKLKVDEVMVFRQDNETNLISIKSLFVGLDLIASLQRGEPVLNNMSLGGLITTVVRDLAGEFQLQGLDLTQQSSQQAIDWLSWASLLNDFQIQDVTIHYIDQLNNAWSGQYHVTSGELTHHSERWTATGWLQLPSTLGDKVRLSGQWVSESADLQISSWQAQAQIDDLILAPFAQQIVWQDVGVQSGLLSANISANGVGSAIHTIKTSLNLTQTELVSTQDDKASDPVLIERLEGQIDWDKHDQSWQLTGQNLHIKMEGLAWPATNFSIKKQENDWTITSDYLRLSDFTTIASLSAESPEVIIKQQPAGDLESLNVHYSVEEGLTSLAFNIHEGALLPWQDYPGVTGLTASVDWQAGMAKLKLNSYQVTFYPETWLEGAVFFDSVTGELDLQRQDQKWTLQSNGLRLWNDDLNIEVDGSVQNTSDDKLINDLTITLQDVVVNRWQAYVPQKLLSSNFKKWSKDAFVAGNIIDGTIELKGDLAAFPYDMEPDKGQFNMAVQAENVQLHFAPGWPDISDLTGMVTISGNDLIIKEPAGKIAGFKLANVTTTINQLFDDEPILRTEGNLMGTTADALSFLQKSPLKHRFGKIAEAVKAQGLSNIQLSLMVPLADEDATEASGNVSFIDSQLRSQSIPDLAMSKVNGKLNFSNDGVTAKNIKALVLDEPITLDVSPKNDATIVLASGKVLIQQAQKRWPDVLPKFIAGETAYEVEVTVSEKTIGDFNVDASVRSDLKGIQLDIPEPFGKKAGETNDFKVSIKQEGDTTVYAVDYDKLIKTVWAQDGKKWRGEVNVGDGPLRLPKTGVKVRGQLAELHIDLWSEWIKQYSNEDDDSLFANVDELSVKIGNLTGFEQQLTNLTLSAKQEKKGWLANIHSDQSKGSIFWPTDFASGTAVKVDLDKLNILLSKSDDIDSEQITDEQAQFLWPSLDLAIGSLMLNDMALGKLQLQGHRTTNAWLLDKGSLVAKEFTASILAGEWQQAANGNQSLFKVQMNSDNLAKLLASFGYQQAIEAKDVYLLADLSWPDNPLAVNTKILKGSLKVGLGKGKLKDVEPGAAGRIFGLLSIAALPRRLSLDFSDLFTDGFYFDSIKGSFTFLNGQAITDNFEVKGASAKIKMVGPVDLVHRKYDQKVTVTPNVSSTLPLAGAVAAGPIGLGVGTAILLADKLAGALFDKNIVNVISYDYYLRGPWDAPELTVAKPPKPTTPLVPKQ